MKKSITILTLMLITLTVSCSGEPKNQDTANAENSELKKQPILAENLKKTNLKIEGMTCALGCAKMIESKLARTEGVDSVKVDFEKKFAFVSYDHTQQTEEKLIHTIETLADGKTYKVSVLPTN